jgi:hypothetical protein
LSFKSRNSQHTSVFKEASSVQFQISGDDIASIAKSEFGNYWSSPEGTRLLVKVTVTEAATGKQDTAEDASAVFVQSPFVISYDRMPKFFRPALPFTVKVRILKLTTSLAATMVRWFEGGVNQGLLSMTISEEESNLFCACHLLSCDEGQGQ